MSTIAIINTGGMAAAIGGLDAREVTKAAPPDFMASLGLRPMDGGALPMARTLEHLALLSLGLVAHSIHHAQFALGVSLLAPHHL